MFNFIKFFSKSFYVYALGLFSSNLLILLFIPYLTKIFNPSQFAIIEIFTILITLILILTNFGIGDAQSYYYFKFDKNKLMQKKIISSSFCIKVFLSFCFFTIYFLLINFYQKYYSINNFNSLYLIIFIIAITTSFFNQGLNLLNVQFSHWIFNLFNFSKTILILIFLIIFLYFNNFSINGYFYSYLISYLVSAIFIWIFLKKYLSIKNIESYLIKKLLFYGFPLIFTQLAWYLMTVLDRLFINYYLDKNQLGVYAIAGKFALIINLFVEIFNRTWLPFLMKNINELDNDEDKSREIFKVISKIYVFISSVSILILSLLSSLIIKNFTNVLYHDASYIFPLLCWYLIFYGFFNIISSTLWKEKKTFYTTIVMLISLILNIFLNYFFVPIYGVYGAAFSTIVCFIIMLILTFIFVKKINNISFPYSYIFFNYTLFLLTSFYIIFSNHDYFYKIFLSIILLIVLLFSSTNKLYKLIILKITNLVK